MDLAISTILIPFFILHYYCNFTVKYLHLRLHIFCAHVEISEHCQLQGKKKDATLYHIAVFAFFELEKDKTHNQAYTCIQHISPCFIYLENKKKMHFRAGLDVLQISSICQYS